MTQAYAEVSCQSARVLPALGVHAHEVLSAACATRTTSRMLRLEMMREW